MVAIWIIVSLALVLAVVRLAAWLAKGTRDQRCPTMIVLGSGGHTAEMLRLLRNFDPAAYSPRAYVTAQTDTLSGQKAVSFESSWASSASDFKVARIPRSREVGQSWISSAFSTIYAMFFAVALVFKERPDLVLVNGPGTCIPICAGAFIARLLGLAAGRIVYVESIARVYRLSLSGKILYHTRMANLFIVQWEELKEKYPRSLFAGRLM